MAMVAEILESFDTAGTLDDPPWILTSGSTGKPVVSGGEAGPASASSSTSGASVIHRDVLSTNDMEVSVVIGTVSNNFGILWLGAPNGATDGGTVANVKGCTALQFHSGSLQIYTIGDTGTATQRATATPTLSSGDKLTFRRVDSVYTALINDVVRVTWTDTAGDTARGNRYRAVGMRFYRNGSAVSSTIDSFSAKALGGSGPEFLDVSSAHSASAGATVSLDYPTGSAPGDLLILYAGFQRSPSSGTQTLNVPSGWTALHNISPGAGMMSAVYWRFRGAETSVSVTASSGTSMFGTLQIHAYGGNIDSNPIEASQLVYVSTTGTGARSFPSITTGVVNCALSFFVDIENTLTGRTLSFGGTVSGGSTLAEVVDAYQGTSGDILYGSAIATKQTAGSTGSLTVTPSASSNESLLAVVAIRPAQSASLADSDVSGTAAESQGTTATAPPANDTGTGTEPAVVNIATRVPGDTSATAAETGKVTANVPASDPSGAAAETGKVTASTTASDASEAAVESAIVSNTVVASDTGSGADAISPLAVKIPTDTGTGTETQSTTALVRPSDTGSATETATGGSNVPASDIVPAATESNGAVRVQASDTGQGVDTAKYASTVFGSDSAVGTDTSTVAVVDADTGTGTDSAFKSRSGILDTPRLITVPKETRRFVVERENRTVTVGPEVRRIAIGKDLAPRSKMPHRNGRTLGIPAERRVLVITREE